MGKPNSTGADLASVVVTANLAALNAATPWAAFDGMLNLEIQGTFVAGMIVERSFDGGVTASPCTDRGLVITFSAPASEVLRSDEPGTLFRVRMASYTSGSASVRLSQ